MRFHKLVEYLQTPFGRQMLGIGKGSADFSLLVARAQKFYVGDVAILDGVGRGGASEYPRLPFEICAFEFQDQDPKGITQSFFLLAEELGYSAPVDRVRIHSFVPYPMPGNSDDLWMHNGYLEINRENNTYDGAINRNTLKFLDAGDGFDKLADTSQIETSMRSSAEWLWSFLTVLNCSNVRLVETAAPAALNKKRERKGRPPIYTYKTLVLKQWQRMTERGLGTHESPRIHLRRGHIKRRATGNFWWEPCVVGNRKRGIVMKDYRATELVTAEGKTAP